MFLTPELLWVDAVFGGGKEGGRAGREEEEGCVPWSIEQKESFSRLMTVRRLSWCRLDMFVEGGSEGSGGRV